MDLIDQLQGIASRIPEQLEYIQTEEATKNAFIMPFIQTLGYNVFDPREVVPEFTADVGTKKGEKVDYAIMKDGKPILLIECKTAGSALKLEHASQLYRYFSVTDARIAVLTNGVQYRFYSDLESANRMDEAPFLELDMLDLNEQVVAGLKKLTKGRFNVAELVEHASELKYTQLIKSIFARQLAEPDEEFVNFFLSQFYTGRRTPAVKEQFTPLVRRALNAYISERIAGRLSAALMQEEQSIAQVDEPEALAEVAEEDDDGIVTTDDERDGYWLVRTLLRPVVESERVVMRDVKSYCGILLDDNNRKPICRLRFNAASQLYLGLFDNPDRQEEKIPIDSIDDINLYAERLLRTLAFYDDELAAAVAAHLGEATDAEEPSAEG